MKLRLLMVCIILPTLVLATFYALQLIRQDQETSRLAHETVLRSGERVLINNLIHELQKERGYSAGFISSERQNFPAELRDQRHATDVEVTATRGNIPLSAADRPTPYDTVVQALGDLPAVRRRVDDLALTVPQMAGFYTALINDLLLLAHPAGDAGSEPTLADLQAARSFIAAAKESAGLERATGATGLSAGFSPPVLAQFSRLRGAQESLLLEATRGQSNTERSDAIFNSAELVALNAARATIAAGHISGDFDDLTAPRWFVISTNWIEFLRAQERLLANQIENAAMTLDQASEARLTSNILLGAISIFCVALGAFVAFEYMIRRIKRLTSVVDGFAKGDFSQWVPGIKHRDEISAMARSIYKFKQETLALRREALDMKQADEATLNAKHGRVVDLVTEGLAALAQADLSIRFQDPLDGEYDQIRQDFNEATQRLCDVLVEINESVGVLGRSSEDMNSSALDLAARTTEQVKTIGMTTEQVSALSSEVDDFGREVTSAATEAAEAREMTSQSAKLMAQVEAAMGRIKGSSEEIGKIISMIDDIAFQTNLLALNAGVEAARAGDAGRGFAVVASEVGNLAQRASQATLEIKALVEDSGGHVAEGVELVDRTGKALGKISGKIMQVDDVLIRVSDSSKDQVSQLKELAIAMNRINDLTAKNTEMADQTETSSADIAASARQLAALITDFRLARPQSMSQAA